MCEVCKHFNYKLPGKNIVELYCMKERDGTIVLCDLHEMELRLLCERLFWQRYPFLTGELKPEYRNKKISKTMVSKGGWVG